MDYQLELSWKELVSKLNHLVEGDLNLDNIIFLIGVQEYGKGYQSFKKDDKINLMHIAVCTLLEPYGFYEFEGLDTDGWPHFKLLKNIPPLNSDDQQTLMKKAVLNYFTEVE